MGLLMLLVSLLGCSKSGSVQRDPQNGERIQSSASEFVLGNIEFVLLHELSHLVIDDRNVPILGTDELAADTIAATFLIRGTQTDQLRDQRMQQYAIDAALFFESMWNLAKDVGAENDYWDEHGLSVQRFNRIACLYLGSNPEDPQIRRILENTTRDRAEACILEYEKAEHAIRWLLEDYGRKAGDTSIRAVKISYGDPGSTVQQRHIREIRERKLIETTIEEFQSRFSIPESFSVAFRRCGSADARWIVEKREILICYELIDIFRIFYASMD